MERKVMFEVDLFLVFLTLLVMPQTQTMITLYIFYSWMALTYDLIEVVGVIILLYAIGLGG
jgi:ABC-type glycerol-3-phosphate transport system permease component